MGHELPLIGDADAEYYMRQEGKGLLLGVYEDVCVHWAEKGTPLDFGHELLPNALERIERNLAQACEAVPCLGRAGLKRVINGPMIFSPDLAPLIGPYPGKANYWTACGVMTGFSQAAAIGMITAAWMSDGEPPMDVFMWDVARFGRWAGKDYAKAVPATCMPPGSSRSILRGTPGGPPSFDHPGLCRLSRDGGVFGASDGVEYPLWFAPKGVEAKDSLTFRRPNWWPHVGAECKALANGVGIIDISTYGKHIVRGPGAHAWLDRMMANRMPTRDGQMVLTPMLSPKGRLVGEFSVAQMSPEEFLLVGSGTADRYHHRSGGPICPRMACRSTA